MLEQNMRQRHRRRRRTSAGRRPARRARPRTTPTPGSAATRRSSQATVWVGYPSGRDPDDERARDPVAGGTFPARSGTSSCRPRWEAAGARLPAAGRVSGVHRTGTGQYRWLDARRERSSRLDRGATRPSSTSHDGDSTAHDDRDDLRHADDGHDARRTRPDRRRPPLPPPPTASRRPSRPPPTTTEPPPPVTSTP